MLFRYADHQLTERFPIAPAMSWAGSRSESPLSVSSSIQLSRSSVAPFLLELRIVTVWWQVGYLVGVGCISFDHLLG